MQTTSRTPKRTFHEESPRASRPAHPLRRRHPIGSGRNSSQRQPPAFRPLPLPSRLGRPARPLPSTRPGTPARPSVPPSASSPASPSAALGNAPCPPPSPLELVHNFSLIHDDIQDGDEMRRHKPTVWNVWGLPKALYVGNSMHAAAYQTAHALVHRGVPEPKALRCSQLLVERQPRHDKRPGPGPPV